MQSRGVWVGFLVTCFAITGLVGLFASYATSIPLERALHRDAMLDQALASGVPDPDALHGVLGLDADRVLAGPGELSARLAQARASIRAEADAEQAAIGARARLMLAVVTVLAAGLGAGILLLASRPTTI